MTNIQIKKNTLITHNSILTSKSSGFTLIELLVSSALLVILAGGFVGLQYILSQNQTSAWKSYLSIEAANGAVANMTNELRNAQPSELGSYQIEAANDQELIFYSDYNNSGVVERLRYTLSGNTLTRGITEPTGSPPDYDISGEKVKTITDIVRNGTDPVFYYFNSDWPSDTTNNPLASADRIANTREIKITLKVNSKENDPKNDYLLESFVKLRTVN